MVASGHTLYVAGIDFHVTEDDLHKAFGKYGVLSNVTLIRDHFTGQSRGFGYVCFEDPKRAAEAKEGVTGREFNGKPIKIEYSRTDFGSELSARGRGRGLRGSPRGQALLNLGGLGLLGPPPLRTGALAALVRARGRGFGRGGMGGSENFTEFEEDFEEGDGILPIPKGKTALLRGSPSGRRGNLQGFPRGGPRGASKRPHEDADRAEAYERGMHSFEEEVGPMEEEHGDDIDCDPEGRGGKFLRVDGAARGRGRGLLHLGRGGRGDSHFRGGPSSLRGRESSSGRGVHPRGRGGVEMGRGRPHRDEEGPFFEGPGRGRGESVGRGIRGRGGRFEGRDQGPREREDWDGPGEDFEDPPFRQQRPRERELPSGRGGPRYFQDEPFGRGGVRPSPGRERPPGGRDGPFFKGVRDTPPNSRMPAAGGRPSDGDKERAAATESPHGRGHDALRGDRQVPRRDGAPEPGRNLQNGKESGKEDPSEVGKNSGASGTQGAGGEATAASKGPGQELPKQSPSSAKEGETKATSKDSSSKSALSDKPKESLVAVPGPASAKEEASSGATGKELSLVSGTADAKPAGEKPQSTMPAKSLVQATRHEGDSQQAGKPSNRGHERSPRHDSKNSSSDRHGRSRGSEGPSERSESSGRSRDRADGRIERSRPRERSKDRFGRDRSLEKRSSSKHSSGRGSMGREGSHKGSDRRYESSSVRRESDSRPARLSDRDRDRVRGGPREEERDIGRRERTDQRHPERIAERNSNQERERLDKQGIDMSKERDYPRGPAQDYGVPPDAVGSRNPPPGRGPTPHDPAHFQGTRPPAPIRAPGRGGPWNEDERGLVRGNEEPGRPGAYRGPEAERWGPERPVTDPYYQKEYLSKPEGRERGMEGPPSRVSPQVRSYQDRDVRDPQNARDLYRDRSMQEVREREAAYHASPRGEPIEAGPRPVQKPPLYSAKSRDSHEAPHWPDYSREDTYGPLRGTDTEKLRDVAPGARSYPEHERGYYESPRRSGEDYPATAGYGKTDYYDRPPDSVPSRSDPYNQQRDSYGPPHDSLGQPRDPYAMPKESYGPPRDSHEHARDPYSGTREEYNVLSDAYNAPKGTYGASNYGAPRDTHGPAREGYGAPSVQYDAQRDHYPPSKDPHGPPKDAYGHPRDTYASAKDMYRPVREVPPREQGTVLESYGPTKDTYEASKDPYGPAKEAYPSLTSYPSQKDYAEYARGYLSGAPSTRDYYQYGNTKKAVAELPLSQERSYSQYPSRSGELPPVERVASSGREELKYPAREKDPYDTYPGAPQYDNRRGYSPTASLPARDQAYSAERYALERELARGILLEKAGQLPRKEDLASYVAQGRLEYAGSREDTRQQQLVRDAMAEKPISGDSSAYPYERSQTLPSATAGSSGAYYQLSSGGLLRESGIPSYDLLSDAAAAKIVQRFGSVAVAAAGVGSGTRPQGIVQAIVREFPAGSSILSASAKSQAPASKELPKDSSWLNYDYAAALRGISGIDKASTAGQAATNLGGSLYSKPNEKRVLNTMGGSVTDSRSYLLDKEHGGGYVGYDRPSSTKGGSASQFSSMTDKGYVTGVQQSSPAQPKIANTQPDNAPPSAGKSKYLFPSAAAVAAAATASSGFGLLAGTKPAGTKEVRRV